MLLSTEKILDKAGDDCHISPFTASPQTVMVMAVAVVGRNRRPALERVWPSEPVVPEDLHRQWAVPAECQGPAGVAECGQAQRRHVRGMPAGASLGKATPELGAEG